MSELAAHSSANVVSFDVEEHFRIEAAFGFECTLDLKTEYARRMDEVTRKLLDQLASAQVVGSFYIVGEIAVQNPALIKAIHAAGHEVGSHSWDHRRVHHFTPETFREDLIRSKETLEQVTGAPVLGFRAPTFSIMRETAWAIDALVECGFLYDSSIFPVRHDRYGVPDAPRSPFLAVGQNWDILEIPPATFHVMGLNLPVAGGGYFRLFPLAFMEAGLKQIARSGSGSVGMLYFHPWEFDPDQPRLPLKGVSRWRTYVGMTKTTGRLETLLRGHSFRRAIDVVRELNAARETLPRFKLASEERPG